MTDLLQFGWIGLHLAGIVLAWFVRGPGRLPGEKLSYGFIQASFLVVLVLVAMSAVVGNCFDWSIWTLSALTLSLMVVTAVTGFDPHPA